MILLLVTNFVNVPEVSVIKYKEASALTNRICPTYAVTSDCAYARASSYVAQTVELSIGRGLSLPIDSGKLNLPVIEVFILNANFRPSSNLSYKYQPFLQVCIHKYHTQ